MIQFHIFITSIALLTSVACCMPGIFLILRGVALMSDAISHAILPGIVIMFLYTKNLESPWLILGAACAGVATVILTESIIYSKRLKKDAAIGLVFPLFFSLGIILMSKYTSHIHLDVDMVILGELIFTPFDRWYYHGVDMGPCALWIMGVISLMNAFFLSVFYKELTISSFDPIFAHLLGFYPTFFYYGLMLVTSVTAVAAFNSVGSIVIVTLMIIPAACGYLIAHNLSTMIQWTISIAVISALLGCVFAHIGNISIAGSITTANGLLFLSILLFSRTRGLLAKIIYHRKLKYVLARKIVQEHRKQLCCSDTITMTDHLGWDIRYLNKIMAEN